MRYNFDEVIDRHNTLSYKWDNMGGRVSNPNALPMWIADSDWACDDHIVDAVRRRAEHPLYGYSFVPEAFKQAIAGWAKRRHGWEFDAGCAVYSPGIIPAIAFSLRTLTKPGDKVLIQQPVYHPFRFVIEDNKRIMVSSDLKNNNGHYEIDFADFEVKAADPDVKMMIFCNPHNPVGRVYTREELERVASICLRNHVVIVSDEIHSDLVYEGHKHIPIASLGREYENNIITLYSPSKSFNIAGLQAAAIVVSNEKYREGICEQMKSVGLDEPNTFAITAFITAYTKGEKYLEDEIRYLQENINYLDEALKQTMPRIKLVRPEGTYLIWLDCSGLGLEEDALASFFIDECQVGINRGDLFGAMGKQFVRINLACPRAYVTEAIRRMQKAYSSKY